MIIIVEGPDGMGKTTLAAELGDRLNAPVYKPWVEDGLKAAGAYIAGHDAGSVALACLTAPHSDVVFDRSFPSDFAYCRAFGRELDEMAHDIMDIAVGRVPHLGVMLTTPDPGPGYELARARGVGDVDRDSWIRAHLAYEEFVAASTMSWHVLDAREGLLGHVQEVMNALVHVRDGVNSKDRVFLEMARHAARRSTCLSRRQGAVLVSAGGHVIAVGYNGAPRGFGHPVVCERLCSGAASGSDLDLCNDSHAEENCIVHAALNGANPEGGTLYTVNSPCHRCARMLINAGIVDVVYERTYDGRALWLLSEANIEVRRLA